MVSEYRGLENQAKGIKLYSESNLKPVNIFESPVDDQEGQSGNCTLAGQSTDTASCELG